MLRKDLVKTSVCAILSGTLFQNLCQQTESTKGKEMGLSALNLKASVTGHLSDWSNAGFAFLWLLTNNPITTHVCLKVCRKKTMHPSVLVVFDFDHTITDGNTDVVARKLLPEEKLPENVKGLYRNSGWIAYMGKIFELLHQNSIDAEQIERAIVNIPAVPGVETLLRELHSRGYEIIIISDSNTIFIEKWLKHKKLDHVIAQTFTNPARIEDNGMMRVDVYHTQDTCKLSTVNLCKGQILEAYISRRAYEGARFERIAYVGDGKNDLCPILRLSKKDIAFPREDYMLIKILNNPENYKFPAVQAQIVPWSDGSHILRKEHCLFGGSVKTRVTNLYEPLYLIGKMSIRRKTDPFMTQRIWDAIKITVHQRSLPSNDRMVRHLARVYGITEQEAQEELNNAVDDGLVYLKKVPTKSGIEQETYRLPSEIVQNDGHDWYCCKCQKAGLVECCEKCHRVYHPECHVPNVPKIKICSFCEKINSDTYPDKMDLNHILSFTCGHLKAKLPPEITNRTIVFNNDPIVTPPSGFSGPTWVSEGEDAWRPGVLIKNHMDLAIMDSKTSKNEYNNLAEFQADAHNILHNMIIYHGAHSIIGEMGLTMYQDCCYDLQEIRRCADCYRISNEKSEKMWFCIPCNPPHQLVYAKQKGYPYWPAKVMQVNGNVYDVRFFGGHHMRANIEKVFIRPITVSLQSLQIKRSTAWNRAFEELKHHQNLLQKLGKNYQDLGSVEDEDGPKPPKIRNIESSSSKSPSNSPNAKQVFKDLRVKVERLSSDGHTDAQPLNELTNNKEEPLENKAGSEERQVPHLPVAEDEPAREISSTCPQGLKKEGSQEDMVTSSCQEPRSKCVLVQTEQIQTETIPAKIKRERRTSEQPTTTAIEKLRRELELDKCKEMERLQAEHAKELRQLTDRHQQIISEIKKKQWCYNCEAEAIYHCCWNTAYCSTDCQQVHWQREHKRVCRRKR
ncbi:hypothetical protein KM043_007237 [Ampulex compressa]|nr:hypothetical protein KM043_007237 [Ampulex compressa]